MVLLIEWLMETLRIWLVAWGKSLKDLTWAGCGFQFVLQNGAIPLRKKKSFGRFVAQYITRNKDKSMTHSASSQNSTRHEGVVTGMPNLMLRAEGALALAGATYFYSQQGFGWLTFALLFFVPDIFMLGFLCGNRLGALVYNIGHTYTVPAALLIAGWFAASPLMIAIALIWIGHIGFDRILGYGLKYDRGFKFSHLSTPPS